MTPRHARTLLIPPSQARASAIPSSTPLSVDPSKNKGAKIIEFEIDVSAIDRLNLTADGYDADAISRRKREGYVNYDTFAAS